ncbi:MAG TPA: acetyl-CoA C-acyltransferase FadI [Myxococcota bacterium]|jgi:acetyl-CoA acyltransferase|nr:acetyl-CoA C-acyltransferase FadI [Myxococcota bacterium]
MTKMNVTGPRGRVAIVAGLRTPFVKSGTAFKDLTALQLAEACVTELVARNDLDPEVVDQVVYGQVVPSTEAPNIAREVVLGTGLPRRIEAYSVSRACATGTQALVSAAHAVLSGDADVVICGGADSLSRPPITVSDGMAEALMEANAARDAMGKAKAFLGLHAKDFLPKTPALREVSTGLTMGESAENMAKENRIARAAQDAFALRSHRKATAAWEEGVYADEVMRFAVPPYQEVVVKDGLVRGDTSLEKLSALKPVFDPKYGSVTAGNSSPLTDGAAALVVMSEARAKELGYEALAFVRAWAFAAVDPAWQLLMGPGFAAPRALERAGMRLADVDLVDMHEAFAAQMLSNLQAFASAAWARQHLARDEAIGEVPDEKLNLYGGSISLGHPFAATGGRQALTMARALARRGGGTALITQCAAGGLGAALILER